MFVLGSGAAFPAVELTDSALAAIRPTPSHDQALVLGRAGIEQRRVSLPLEYILSNKDSDVVRARGAAHASPTALGVDAIKRALSQANLSIEQVGLIIADTATPYQTCPSEAQRIAGAFGIKVPAYDLVAGAQFLPLCVNNLRAWREDRFPEYVVCVSTNVPSQHVRYESDILAGSIVGDAAAAFIFSKTQKATWSVVHSSIRTSARGGSPLTVDRFLAFDESRMMSHEELRRELATEFDSVTARVPEAMNKAWFVGPEMYAEDFRVFAQKRGVSSSRVVSCAKEYGFSMGSSQAAAVSSLLEQAKSGEFVIAVHCENGMSGHVVLVRS